MSFVRTVRMRVPAGTAKPGPAIGQALGPLGINMMEFCKKFNEETKHIVQNTPMPCVSWRALSACCLLVDVFLPFCVWGVLGHNPHDPHEDRLSNVFSSSTAAAAVRVVLQAMKVLQAVGRAAVATGASGSIDTHVSDRESVGACQMHVWELELCFYPSAGG